MKAVSFRFEPHFFTLVRAKDRLLTFTVLSDSNGFLYFFITQCMSLQGNLSFRMNRLVWHQHQNQLDNFLLEMFVRAQVSF